MSVTHGVRVLRGVRGARAPGTRGEAAAACALVVLAASLMGCVIVGDDGRSGAGDEDVATVSLASTFDCASAFGLIGAALYMTGTITVPSGDVVDAATTPAGSPTLDCTNGGTVVIQWKPIKIEVPVAGGMNGKILLRDFVVFGTPGALLPGECVPPTPCHPGTSNPQCADDEELLSFDPQVCTLASFTAGTCQLSSANTNICGTL